MEEKRKTLSLNRKKPEFVSLLPKWKGNKGYGESTPERVEKIHSAEKWLVRNWPDITGVRRAEIKEKYLIENESLNFGIQHLYQILEMLGIN